MKKLYRMLLCVPVIILLAACSGKNGTEQVKTEDDSTVSVTLFDALPTESLPSIAPTISPTPEVQKVSQIPTKAPTGAVVDATEKEEHSKYTVVIDAGHQKHGNYEDEPIGPGAKTTKAKVSSGTQGKYTGIPEYEVNLEVSLKLRDILVEKGYQVIMIRETNDVNISNAERAEVANDNEADVFVRIHCNGSEDSSVNGILTLCPTKNNPYCSEIYKESRSLSDILLKNLCDITGAKNKGVTETDTMSGINWCKVPVTIVEMGYMTNKKEDYKLTDSQYQDTLAQGLANGIEEYLVTEQ